MQQRLILPEVESGVSPKLLWHYKNSNTLKVAAGITPDQIACAAVPFHLSKRLSDTLISVLGWVFIH